jgi:hypothetical protein
MGISREPPKEHTSMKIPGEKPHRITLVGHEDLPPGQDFAFLDCGGELWLALKWDRLTATTLEEAWAVYRATA